MARDKAAKTTKAPAPPAVISLGLFLQVRPQAPMVSGILQALHANEKHTLEEWEQLTAGTLKKRV